MDGFSAAYKSWTQRRGYQIDDNQLRLTALLNQFKTQVECAKSLFTFFQKKEALESYGVYIWGDVGRGKSAIINLFFETLNTDKKYKTHFHEFMLMVHKLFDEYRKKDIADDYIPKIAKDLAKKYKVIILDELQINNIADAMIVGRLFSEIINAGSLVFFTSNRKPNELFKDGLQRERFLPFIDLIYSKLSVFHLSGDTDYRFAKMQNLERKFLYPINAENQKIIDDLLGDEQKNDPRHAEIITIDNSRKVVVQNAYKNMAHFTFAELCEQPMSALDYFAICKNFKTIVLTNIPQMNSLSNNEALRFITLIDCMYDSKTNLIALSACAPSDLYKEGKYVFEFARTISRINEMGL